MQKIILLSGPPCSGKTYLMRAVQGGRINFFQEYSPLLYFNANQVREDRGCIDTKSSMMIHHDSFRYFKRGQTLSGGSDLLFSRLLSFDPDCIMVVHTIAPRYVLLRRLTERKERLRDNISKEREKKIDLLLNLYASPSSLKHKYLEWYRFSLRFSKERILHLSHSLKEYEKPFLEAKIPLIEEILDR